MSEKGEHIVSYLPGGAEDWSSDEDEYFQQLENKVITANGLKNEISPYEQGLQDLKYELREGNVEEMRKILDSPALIGFNIDEDEIERGWNLLLSACYYAKPEVVNFLLSERGVNVNCLSSIDYETPMMVTCLSNENPDDILEVAKILVKHSASTSVGNGMGKTALMFASAAGLIHVVEYLVSLGDNIDVTDNIGSNALIYALEQKQTEVAVFLINNGIDTTVENKYRRSAKIIAEGKRLQDVLDILPQKEKEDFLSSEFLNYTLENMIPGIGETESPAYFPDISSLLNGMSSGKHLKKFAEAKIGLEEFLTISDEKLKEIGIVYPFERQAILLGLYKFHTAETWDSKSLFIPKSLKQPKLSEVEFVTLVANLLRQMIIIKAHITYMKTLGDKIDIVKIASSFRFDQIMRFLQQVETLKEEVRKNYLIPQRPLLINGKQNISKSSIFSTFRYNLFNGLIRVISIFNLPQNNSKSKSN